jgi:hypothetical protein
MLCDSLEYRKFKSLFKTAETAVKKLRGCSTIMPSELLQLPMQLFIECGDMNCAGCKFSLRLVVPSSDPLKAYLDFNDESEQTSVTLFLSDSEYRELKNAIGSADEALERMFADRTIKQNFLTSA